MPQFRIHSIAGLGTGAVYGIAGYLTGMPFRDCLIASSLFVGGSLLPDIDTDSIPLKEISLLLGVCGAVICALIVHENYPNDVTLAASIGAYLVVRFLVVRFFMHCTVHRGAIHSIIMAIILAEIVLFLSSGTYSERFFKALAFFGGFVTHLFLDEIWCFDWKNFRRGKGNALKLFGHRWIINIVLIMVAVTLGIIIKVNG